MCGICHVACGTYRYFVAIVYEYQSHVTPMDLIQSKTMLILSANGK